MDILIALISVIVIAAIAAIVRHAGVPVCPLCIGVSGTWLWLLIARATGSAVDPAVLGLLMGGSAVGIAYQLQKRLPPGRSHSLFLALFTITGFAAADGLITQNWGIVLLGIIALATVAAWAFLTGTHPARKDSASVAAVEKKLENCCS